MISRASLASARSRTTPPSFSGSLRFSSGVAGAVFAGPALSAARAASLLLHAHLLARRNADVQAVELHVIDVLAPQAHQAGVDVKRLHHDEAWACRRALPRRRICRSCLRRGGREHLDGEIAQGDLAVELVRQCGNDALLEDVRRQRHDPRERHPEDDQSAKKPTRAQNSRLCREPAVTVQRRGLVIRSARFHSAEIQHV